MDDGMDTGGTGYTAITVDETIRRNVVKEAKWLRIIWCSDALIRNWVYFQLIAMCWDNVYNAILANYLLWSVYRFTFSFQNQMFFQFETASQNGWDWVDVC